MKTILICVFTFISAANLAAQTAPKVISNPDPVYPPGAATLGYGGTVKVAILANKKGKVKVSNAWGPNAPCSNLDDDRVEKIQKAVVEAAKKLEFEPPMSHGKPTEIEMTVSYSFDANGTPSKGAKGRIVEVGVLQGRAKYLAKPDYPPGARANRVTGAVPISVLVDVDGKVLAASALGGHPVLQESAVIAACRSSFEPVQLSGAPIQANGIITFTFVP